MGRVLTAITGAAAMAFVGAGGGALAQVADGAQRAQEVRIFDRTQIIVKFRPGADPQSVMAAAIAGDRESYRPGGRLGFDPQATGATVVDLGGVIAEPESGRGRFAVERGGRQESGREAPLDGLISRLNADARVQYAQKNYLETPDQGTDIINEIISGGPPAAELIAPQPAPRVPDDPLFVHQWHLKARADTISAAGAPGAANFSRAWERHRPQRAIVVAVVDSGQVFDHSDVAAPLMLPGYDFVSNEFIANDGDGRDTDPTDPGDAVAANACFEGSREAAASWHGSHVSGIAGAATSDNQEGIASPLASGIAILPVRALGRCGGLTSDLAEAMMWAAGLEVPGVPRNQNPARVINASFGGFADACRPLYRDAIRQIRASGAIVVTTAGNEAIDAARKTPANCEDALTVAASDINGALAPYSNFGDHVDILAPGGDLGADLDGNGFPDGVLSIVAGGYDFYQGTSMAAPVVSAALALALSHNPGWTVEDAVARLLATALPRTAAECAEPCGAGLLDVSAAMDLAERAAR